MSKKELIHLFGEQKVRTKWYDDKVKWFFCVVDVVEALTDSKNPSDYIKKMKKRDPELSKGWGQIVTPPLEPSRIIYRKKQITLAKIFA